MHRDDEMLRYGAVVPLARILAHRRLTALTKLGLELRRSAARALNDALLEARMTRIGLARISGIDYWALTQICTARRAMDPEVLKRALQVLGKDWREVEVPFVEAYDRRGRSLPPERHAVRSMSRAPSSEST